MAIELKSYLVAGFDGPSGSLFMLYGGGTADAEDGWSVTFAANAGGTGIVAYVRDETGTHIGTYAVNAEEFCAEALRLGREKKATRTEINVTTDTADLIENGKE